MWKPVQHASTKVKLTDVYVYLLSVVLFIVLVCAYYSFFLEPVYELYTPDNPYNNIANIHDHLVYFERLLFIESNSNFIIDVLSGNERIFDNITGIALFYFLIDKLTLGFLPIENLALFSNLILIIAIFACHFYIVVRFFNNKKVMFYAFLNLPLIYLSQLINKDVIHVLALYLLLICYLRQSLFFFVIIVTFMTLFIRVQFAFLLPIVFIIHVSNLSYANRFFLVLVAISLMSAFLFEYVVGSSYQLPSRSLLYIKLINEKTIFLGSLLFLPLKFVQYCLELVAYPRFIVGGNFMAIFSLPYILYFLKNIKFMFKGKDFWYYNKFGGFLFCSFAILLVSPLTGVRYIILYLPLFVLSVCYYKEVGDKIRNQIN